VFLLFHFAQRRAAVTDEITRSFMDKTRPIDPNPANKVVVQADGVAVAASKATA
jgi:phosphatidylserine decarboxylase